jgi:hypothetical protein
MNYLILFFIVNASIACSCENTQKQGKLNSINNMKDSTVFTKQDSLGRVIEKWGNEKKRDDDINFRTYYFFDSNGNLIREKNYFFEDDNFECKILDSADYNEIFYKYQYIDNKPALIEETKYVPKLDQKRNIVGRELYYIYSEKDKKFVYHKEGNKQ